ncbi:hypothetical protein [Urbanus proteus nucleopolyhedrovirus]|uniref:Ac106 n=1 Tax=Urbanus proteus nucleopolyhedrovirus TaxID=1675866 RepID=A0A162GUZ3_9ABAC|nr:hypothetical protein [Urbanus proteus nucleopolyhedrovirus]AKR17380.1 hypothetical protein [Urbanus proteus nucleopolyhedrovirus]
MEVITVDDFAKQIITDKCSALIENENMLPKHILEVIIDAKAQYLKTPTQKNYIRLKHLFFQTKFVEDSIEYKNFYRRILIIAFKFGLNKCKMLYKNYTHIFEVAINRLNTINPDLHNSPRALLQHYNDCLDSIDNLKNEHHLLSFAKEITTKIFIDAIDLCNAKNANKTSVFDNDTIIDKSRFITDIVRKRTIKPSASAKTVNPLFVL